MATTPSDPPGSVGRVTRSVLQTVSSVSFGRGHNVRRHRRVLAVPRPKRLADCIHRAVEGGGVAALDLRAERRDEDNALGGVAGTDATGERDCLALDVREASRGQIMLDGR